MQKTILKKTANILVCGIVGAAVLLAGRCCRKTRKAGTAAERGAQYAHCAGG